MQEIKNILKKIDFIDFEIENEIITIKINKTYKLDLGNNYNYAHLDCALMECDEFIEDCKFLIELKDNQGIDILGIYDLIEFKYKNNYNQVGNECYTVENIINDIFNKIELY